MIALFAATSESTGRKAANRFVKSLPLRLNIVATPPTMDLHPKAVEFDFVQPLFTERRRGRIFWHGRRDERALHAPTPLPQIPGFLSCVERS